MYLVILKSISLNEELMNIMLLYSGVYIYNIYRTVFSMMILCCVNVLLVFAIYLSKSLNILSILQNYVDCRHNILNLIFCEPIKLLFIIFHHNKRLMFKF